MGIIAIIVLLGAAGLVGIRDQYILDKYVEDNISTIRDAQNRATSFSRSSDETFDVNLWRASITEDGTTLGAIDVSITGAKEKIEHTIKRPSGLTISVLGGGYIYFTPPFAKTYIFKAECVGWQQSTVKPTNEYEPSARCEKSPETTITFSYKNLSQEITVNNTGDVTIKNE